MIRVCIRLIAAILLVGAAGAGVAFSLLTGAMSPGAWAAGQVVAIINTYIVPDFDFETVRLSRAEGGGALLSLTDVSLTAPDGTRVVAAGGASFVLRQWPQRGAPVVIERVALRDGELRLIRGDVDDANPGSPRGFKGLAPFVKRDNFQRQDELPSSVRLSNVLKIRQLEVERFSIAYDPADGSEVVRLDDINSVLNASRVEAGGDEGWHAIDLRVDRSPVMALVLDGRVNLDDLLIDANHAELDVDLRDEGRRALPPVVQALLADHKVDGVMEITTGGFVNVREWADSALRGGLTLQKLNFDLGERQINMDHARVGFQMSEGEVTVSPGDANLFGGALSFVGSLRLDEPDQPFNLRWAAQDIRLEQTFDVEPGQEARLSGALAAEGEITAALQALPGSLSGDHRVTIRDARLARDPVFGSLLNSFSGGLLGPSDEPTDQFDAQITLTGTGLDFTHFELMGHNMAAIGSGTLGYDASLDFLFRAGALEALRGRTPVLGQLVGLITDRFSTFRLTGTMQEPRVELTPFQQVRTSGAPGNN